MARRNAERPAESGARRAETNAVAAYLTALKAPKVPARSRANLERRRPQIERRAERRRHGGALRPLPSRPVDGRGGCLPVRWTGCLRSGVSSRGVPADASCSPSPSLSCSPGQWSEASCDPTVLDDDESSEPAGVTDADHGRLVDVCAAAAEDDAHICADLVDAFVVDAEDAGCGYTETAEMMSW
jgi:hypothetical protein